jgi:predicted nicotinamide N-methyase
MPHPVTTDGPHNLRRALLARIHRRYATYVEPVRIGDLAFDFVRIADPNRVLDEVAEREDRREKVEGSRRNGEELHLPYWAELWDSAAGVCQYLLRAGVRDRMRGRSVLDLGCGMGLTGTVAAAVGADVTFADLEPDALLFARLNASQFDLRAHARRVNWQKDRLAERFGLILGADILYEKKQWDFLEPFWQHHLDQGGEILLGEPGRVSGDVFIDWLRTKPWTLEEHAEKVETRERPIRLFRLTRK